MENSLSVVKKKDCRLCDSPELELAFSLKPTPSGDAYLLPGLAEKIKETFPLDLSLCNNCGLLQLLDVVDPKILYGNYIYSTSDSLGLVDHFDKYAEEVMQRIKPRQKDMVVDIGSNDGTLLKSFGKRGMNILGIEPANGAADKSKRNGIPTIQDFFNSNLAEKIKKERGHASIITANNVLANLDNLEDIIKGVSTLLSPEGVFVFETGYMVDLINNNIFDNIYHEHISYFSVKPLASFFRRNGMELIHVKHSSTKGGSIRGTVKFNASSREISDSVKEFLYYETRSEMNNIKTFKSFYSRITEEKNRMQSEIAKIKSNGGKVAGYGASVGVTTMLYEWELGNSLSFLIDDNSSRQNLLSPGFKIPILSPEALYEKKPEAVLILAWRYSEPILNKNKKYLQQGGKFIVPFSESRINRSY